jgi:Family of unknown function (DUF5995)
VHTGFNARGLAPDHLGYAAIGAGNTCGADAVEVEVLTARLRLLSVTLGLAVLTGTPALQSAAHADDPLYVGWASLLPGLTDRYDPNSSNDCVAGRLSCITAIEKEMEQRFRPLAEACSHNAVFALTYLRVTQTYKWSAQQPSYYVDMQWMNHAVAVFAKYYLRAYDTWLSDSSSPSLPQAWRMAFDAAANRRVAGSGNLMLGINAHINRDLAFAMAAAGLAAPDGTSEKLNFDKVNQVLSSVTAPLLAELAARFDPSVQGPDTPYALDTTATTNLIFGWREQAWRNAEALADAPTEDTRALISQQIETNSVTQAQTWLTSTAYTPPLTGSTDRDAWCAIHHWDDAPMPYPFGTPSGS